MAVTGSLKGNVYLNTPRPLNVTLGANVYPNGTISFNDIAAGQAYWFNDYSTRDCTITVYLCDSAGNNRVKIFDVTAPPRGSNTTTKTATISGAQALAGKALYVVAGGEIDAIIFRNISSVTINTANLANSITCASNGNGTLSASANSAAPGATITLTPSPSTGYQLASYTTSPSLTITNNTFTMPNQAVTITATFSKKSYSITKKVSPSGAGTVTCASSAKMGDSVSISQSPASGYVFDKWTTSPSLTISSGHFTMPAQAVTVTANYVKLSTGSLSSGTVTGGGTATLTITTASSSYTHKYRLYYNSSIYTSQVSVAAGTTRVTVSIPASWADNIPNATTKSGCYLRIWTYKDGTSYGYTDITNITYQVPSDAKPSLGSITKSIARTISGVTYADIGDYYTQNKCGVRVQATATANYSATIASINVALSGYSGTKYNKTFTYSAASASVDFTTGLLTISGKTTITVTATDSRGRTKSSTTTVTVTAYSPPSGTLAVWRTDQDDNTDPMGTYGRFSLTKKYTAVGTNSLTVTLTARSTTETVTGTSGRLLPNSRKTFDIETQYTIKLTLTDAFGSTVINMTLPSAMFIIYVNAAGDKLSFMKAATKAIPSGKNATIEFSGNAQIYIGDSTLEDYIRNIVNNM